MYLGYFISNSIVDVSPRERQRRALSAKWTDAAHETDAASITIVNDVDGEAIPPLPRDFLYIENRYI